jgi:hypothetical protein
MRTDVHGVPNGLHRFAHAPEDVGHRLAGREQVLGHTVFQTINLFGQVRARPIHLVADHYGAFVHDVDS